MSIKGAYFTLCKSRRRITQSQKKPRTFEITVDEEGVDVLEEMLAKIAE